MRYIYYIIFILVAMTAIVGYELVTISTPPRNVALVINKKTITTDEFNSLYSSPSAHHEGKDDFINSLITKELMIQESQKEGIDKDEAFRRSLQNFYEQSLIKLLMDRKFASVKITISGDELNNYLGALDRKFHITMFRSDDADKAKKADYINGESKVVRLEDLSKDIRDKVVSLREGQVTEPLKIEGKYIVVRLDKIEKLPPTRHSDKEKESIIQILKEDRKEKIISEWIADLRKKATITNFLKTDN